MNHSLPLRWVSSEVTTLDLRTEVRVRGVEDGEGVQEVEGPSAERGPKGSGHGTSDPSLEENMRLKTE